MTDEQAIAILERGTTIPGDGVTWEQIQEATARAVSALRAGHSADTGKMVPLTMEQLLGMLGRKVLVRELETGTEYVETLQGFSATEVHLSEDDGTDDYGAISLYGETWVAYDYQPTHIDRDSAGDSNVLTNGDRIRTMANGDLARFLLDVVISDAIPFCRCLAECEEDMEADRPIPESRCLECMENWLGKEAQA